jgi:nucleotide-binding universal stress UspA family protein
VALGGKDVDVDAARGQAGDVPLVEDERNPVDALADAGADLIVVGSRGLHGVRALGSVSERVAHWARCSVLVVRASD